jgi:hypothetical protein
MTTRIVQANKAQLSFGNRPHPSEPMSFSVAIGCAHVPDFSVISVRQIEFLRTTAPLLRGFGTNQVHRKQLPRFSFALVLNYGIYMAELLVSLENRAR